MNASSAGVNLKYIPRHLKSLSLNAGADYTLKGRNMGQSRTIYGGVFYIFNFTHNSSTHLQFKTN